MTTEALTENSASRAGTPARAVLWLAVALRIYGAYAQRFSRDVDCALQALMTRSIATGRDFPVFYWGQEYLGLPDIWLMAGLVRCFGEWPGIWSILPTLSGIATLVIVFHWGRRLGGDLCAAVAVAWLAIGPELFFHYHTLPKSYSTIVLLNVVVLWRVAVAIERWRDGRRVAPGELFLVGLCGGLGWWCSPLTTAALAAAAAAWVVFLRRQAFRPQALAAIGGFLLGSLPVWVWNVNHDFRSWNLAHRVTPARVGMGFRQLYAEILPAAFNPAAGGRAGGVFSAAALGIAAVALAVALAGLARRIAGKAGARTAREAPSLVLTTCFLLASVAQFVSTRFGQFGGHGAGRYLYAAFAVFALLLGFAAAAAARAGRGPAAAAAVAVAFLIVLQGPALGRELALAREDREAWRGAADLARDLRRRGVEAMVVNRFRFWLNVATDGEVVFWHTEGRYRPYWERVEAARILAVADDFGDMPGFLARAGGSARHVALPHGLGYWTDFRPPAPARTVAAGWRAVSGTGEEPIPELNDDVYESALQLRPDEYREVDVVLAAEASVCGVRWIFPGQRRLKQVGVRVWDAERREWRDALEMASPPDGMWLGDRPYFGGAYRWVDIRFAPVRTDRLRLRLQAHRRQSVRLAEVYVLEPGETAEGERGPVDVAALMEILKSRAPDRIVADRWVAARLRESWPDAPPLIAEPYRDDRNAAYNPMLPPEGRTAIVTGKETAASTGNALRLAGWKWDAAETRSYAVFFAEPDAAAPRALRWTGFGVLLSDGG